MYADKSFNELVASLGDRLREHDRMTGAEENNMRELKKLDELNSAIDNLASDARDVAEICPEAKVLLDLAWFFTEKAYREQTGHCSVHSSGWCACCHHYNELRGKAMSIKGRL